LQLPVWHVSAINKPINILSMNTALRTGIAFLAILILSNAHAEDDPGGELPSTSPNGRFVIRQIDDKEQVKFGKDNDSSLAIFDTKTRKLVSIVPSEIGIAFPESLYVIWSKDSTRLALNFRAGGRYCITSLLRLDGGKFIELPSPVETLEALAAKTKLEAVKSMGLNPDTYQRRIYDTFVTRRWLDGNTIEADARSVSSVLIKEKDGENSEDVIASFRCIVKWNSKTKTWTILKTKKLKEN